MVDHESVSPLLEAADVASCLSVALIPGVFLRAFFVLLHDALRLGSPLYDTTLADGGSLADAFFFPSAF